MQTILDLLLQGAVLAVAFFIIKAFLFSRSSATQINDDDIEFIVNDFKRKDVIEDAKMSLDLDITKM